MKLVVQRWGNSLALRLPKAVAKDLDIDSGTAVELRSNGQEIVITRVAPKLSLSALVSRITDTNRHGEINASPAKGKEVW